MAGIAEGACRWIRTCQQPSPGNATTHQPATGRAGAIIHETSLDAATCSMKGGGSSARIKSAPPYFRPNASVIKQTK